MSIARLTIILFTLTYDECML